MLDYEKFSNLILSYSSVSNKKLQKLCYYVYSWYLTLYQEKIADVNFEAWVHGPVSLQIYEIYKCYGWNDIPRYNGNLEVNNKVKERVTNIIVQYMQFDADKLEKLTHKEKPWQKARIGYRKYESSNKVIEDKDIIEFYKKSELYDEIIVK